MDDKDWETGRFVAQVEKIEGSEFDEEPAGKRLKNQKDSYYTRPLENNCSHHRCSMDHPPVVLIFFLDQTHMVLLIIAYIGCKQQSIVFSKHWNNVNCWFLDEI